jgi:addiction module HigA family antidote
MPMFNPCHPGEILREEFMRPLGLTVTATARALNVSRKVLSDIVNERAGISPLMAIRLARAFDGDPAFWLRLQNGYDLAQAGAAARKVKVKPLYKAA